MGLGIYVGFRVKSGQGVVCFDLYRVKAYSLSMGGRFKVYFLTWVGFGIFSGGVFRLKWGFVRSRQDG